MSGFRRFLESVHFNTERLLMVLIIVFGGMFFVLASETYLADSEIWGVTLAKKLFDAGNNNSVYFKIPFYFLLRLIYEIPGDNFMHFQYARLAFFFVAVGVLILTYYLAKRIFHRSYVACLAVLLTITATMFLNRGFRIRSDILSLFFSLILIHMNLNFFESNIRATWKQYFVKFLLMYGVALSTTPKAIYLLFWNFVFVLVLRFKKAPLDRAIYFKPYRYGMVYPMILGIIFFAISTLMSWLGGSNVVFEAYYAAWSFFYDALVTWNLNDLATQKLYFFARFVRDNLLLVILAFTPIIGAVAEVLFKRRFTYMNAFRIATLAFFFSVFTYNDLLPFFIAIWIPFLAISAGGYIYELPKIIGKTFGISSPKVLILRTPIVLAIAVYFSVNAGMFFVKNLKHNTNDVQRATIRTLENYLADFPEATHYDVIGILPRNNSVYKFAGPGQGYQNRRVAQYIGELKPDFIFYVRKASLMEPILSQVLAKDYAEMSNGIYARGITYFSKGKDVRLLEQVATSGVSIEGRDYWVIPSDTIASELEVHFPSFYEGKIYFYVDTKQEERRAGLVNYRRGEEEIGSLELKQFPPHKFLEKGEFLIDTSVVSMSITPYPPISLPYSTHMFINFSFDTAF